MTTIKSIQRMPHKETKMSEGGVRVMVSERILFPRALNRSLIKTLFVNVPFSLLILGSHTS